MVDRKDRINCASIHTTKTLQRIFPIPDIGFLPPYHMPYVQHLSECVYELQSYVCSPPYKLRTFDAHFIHCIAVGTEFQNKWK